MKKLIVVIIDGDIWLSEDVQQLAFQYGFSWAGRKKITLDLQQKYITFNINNDDPDYKNILYNKSCENFNHKYLIPYLIRLYNIKKDEIIFIDRIADFKLYLKYGVLAPNYNDTKELVY